MWTDRHQNKPNIEPVLYTVLSYPTLGGCDQLRAENRVEDWFLIYLGANHER